MSSGHFPTRIDVEPVAEKLTHGHLSPDCWTHPGSGGPACPVRLAMRLPDELPEHSWPWIPRVGPGARAVTVPTDHSLRDVVR